jgi:hypothetical protein
MFSSTLYISSSHKNTFVIYCLALKTLCFSREWEKNYIKHQVTNIKFWNTICKQYCYLQFNKLFDSGAFISLSLSIHLFMNVVAFWNWEIQKKSKYMYILYPLFIEGYETFIKQGVQTWPLKFYIRCFYSCLVRKYCGEVWSIEF